MNGVIAIYNAETFKKKCTKVALFIDLSDRPSRYVQSAFALHQLFIFNVAMQYTHVHKDVCLLYIAENSSISEHCIYIYKHSKVVIQ